MKRVLLPILLSLYGCLPFMAQNSDTVQKLVFSKNDSTEISFLLSEEPRITLEYSIADGYKFYSFKVDTLSGVIRLVVDDLNKMTIVSENVNSILDVIDTVDSSIILQNDVILIEVASGQCPLALYSIDGKVILTKTLSQGSHALPISNLQKGIYVITINGETLKFQKR